MFDLIYNLLGLHYLHEASVLNNLEERYDLMNQVEITKSSLSYIQSQY